MCPHCQHDARFVDRRGKWCETLLGSIRLERCYYHCQACHQGYVPWDQTWGLGITKLSPAASEVVSMAGVDASFAVVCEKKLWKMSGLKMSESTVERVTEGAGERLRKLLEAKVTFGEERQWEWQRDAHGKTCAYVSIDATGVRQQGPGGSKAEGRMAYVSMIYNARSEHDPRQVPPHCVRYLAGFYDLSELGLQLRRQAAHVGWDEAEQQIALSDGGSGMESFLKTNFPLAEIILDFWHASEYLTELGQAMYPADDAHRKKQVSTWCHQLKHEGGRAMLATLESLELSGAPPGAQVAHADCMRYFGNHCHKMDYPRYLANGWQIGSGPVESACKTVVGNRLKGGGMRWGKEGSDAVCHLRALYLSETDQWDTFWKTYPN